MMRYKNLGITSKTFYGVKFNPGETHDVPGYINHSNFIRVDDKKKEDKIAKPTAASKSDTKKSDIEPKKPDAVAQVSDVSTDVPEVKTPDTKVPEPKSSGK